MDIALLIALIVLNGVFAMSEIALVTARKSRLLKLAEGGDSGAVAALRLKEEPTQFLSTVQIGITAIGILNGIVGEAALAGPLSELLQTLGIAQKTSSVAATTLVVVVITYVSIVLGELVPKRVAQFNAEGIARTMAKPIAALALVSRPFVFLLSASTEGLLKLLGKKDVNNANLTEEDIHAMLDEGSEAGLIEEHEHEMLRNVFRLDDRPIASFMTPRKDIIYLDLEQAHEEILETLIASEHSRFPVCKGGLHNILGVMTANLLLKLRLKHEPADKIIEYLLPATYVPETVTGMKALAQFQESGMKLAFVIDEYGEILGIITLQDLVEALTGEFASDTEEQWAVQREDGSWLLDGLIPIPELKDRLNLKSVPEEGRYHTLSGMMMCLIGKVPRTGELATWQGWKFEVIDLDGQSIDKVLAMPLAGPK